MKLDTEDFPIPSESLKATFKSLFPLEASPKDLYTTNFLSVDKNGEVWLHQNHIKGAQNYNELRKELRKNEALKLKKNYPELWGKRGGAKQIAFGYGLLDLRAIQKLMKDYP